MGELWCKEGKEEEEDDEEEEQDEVKFLPTTIEGLKKRFNKLFGEFMGGDKQQQHKKVENRNELVYLLDEMLHMGILAH